MIKSCEKKIFFLSKEIANIALKNKKTNLCENLLKRAWLFVQKSSVIAKSEFPIYLTNTIQRQKNAVWTVVSHSIVVRFITSWTDCCTMWLRLLHHKTNEQWARRRNDTIRPIRQEILCIPWNPICWSSNNWHWSLHGRKGWSKIQGKAIEENKSRSSMCILS